MLKRYNSTSATLSSPAPWAARLFCRRFSKSKSKQNNKDEEFEDMSCWQNLPVGAEQIIRQMAAEMILQQLLDKVNERNNVEHEAIYNIVREFPGACLKPMSFVWEDGSVRSMLPLAIVCCLRPPLKTVQAVFEANPKAVFIQEPVKNSLPLHLASAFEASLEVVQFIYSKNPDAIQTPRNDGVYPLHLACGFYLGEPSVVNFLMDKYPEGATKVCSGISWTPFHSAAHGGIPDVDVLTRLYELEPSAIRVLDKHGRTPLHLATRSRNGNKKNIEFLVKANPASMQGEDFLDGWTPLFLASIYQSPETIETLLDLMPAATRIVNPVGGASLLHWAAIGNSSKAVSFLAQRFPEMLSMQTTDGAKDTPLSCAIDNDAPIENIQALIDHYPRALFVKDGVGRRPLVSARCSRANKEVIRLLEQAERKHKDLRSRFFW